MSLNFLTVPFTAILTFCYKLTVWLGVPSYGLAIVLLTVVIKMFMYPFTLKQVRSMEATQGLQPHMRAIQEKYKDDKPKLQMEIANLYKTSGVNPLSGCLPMLIQMPILTALFYSIREYQAMAGASFLWLPDLARGASISLPSDPYFIIPALCALTTYLQQRQTAANMAGKNQLLLLGMPAFIGYMTITFPAGLGVYWTVSNIIQLLQQCWIRRKTICA